MAGVRVAAPNMADEPALLLLRASFDAFLKQHLPREYVIVLLRRYIGSVKPLERVEAILKASSEPPCPAKATPDVGCGSRKKPRSWVTSEDTRLLAAVHLFGLENWGSVAQFVGNGRTREQCAQRWARGLDPRISRDQWSPGEEEKLVAAVRETGGRTWTRIAGAMGNRSDVQCRYHFLQMYRDGKLPPDLEVLLGNERPKASPEHCPPPFATLASASDPEPRPLPPNCRAVIAKQLREATMRETSRERRANLPAEPVPIGGIEKEERAKEAGCLIACPDRGPARMSVPTSDLLDWRMSASEVEDEAVGMAGWW
jgi:hypothetical protein